ncbi:uncharacterized protein LOC121381536 [Gigantopelta aegis]|uniref:uncharacterized protein LOC121381536 n=1 Tax=Gigantopelta aegis TaxID=1735272 RepID=UPI001B888549|nr:uncharacterized protein LOC121381536 [Gigantopelta aegis]
MVLMCDSNASVSTTPTINENVTVQLNNPEIVINDSSGRPCFLGSVNLTIVINYHSETDEGRGRVIRLPMADDVVTRGDCADWNSTPLLSMTWPNGTLQLNLTFHFHKTFVDNNNKTATGKWSLSNVSIHVSDSFFPPGTVGVDAEMSMKHNVTLFVTRITVPTRVMTSMSKKAGAAV